jgi:ribosomal protein S18 acetylase RimI-like enzyme
MKWRDYKPEDKAACLEIFQSNVPDYFAPNELSDVTRLLDGLLCPYLVVENDENQLIASGGIWADPIENSATLCWVMVGRHHHGKGIGRLLVLQLLNLLRLFPFVTLVKLDTSQHTTVFYEKLGFTKCGFVENYYADGLHRYDMAMIWSQENREKVFTQLTELQLPHDCERN